MDHFLKCIKLLKNQYGYNIAFQLSLFLTTLAELLSEAKLLVSSVISYLYFLDNTPIKTGYIQIPEINLSISLWICVWLCLQIREITTVRKKMVISKLGETKNNHEEQNNQKNLKTKQK